VRTARIWFGSAESDSDKAPRECFRAFQIVFGSTM